MTPPDRDPARVRALFGRVARRYRLANSILSAGLDVTWRRRTARVIAGWKPEKVLDVATGTGDLARTIERACPEAEVIGSDFTPEMLEVARALGSTRLVQADALALPFGSEFDVVCAAFGLRNMASWLDALREMARVLKPNGHVAILDFSLPTGALRHVYRAYLHRVLPRLAGFLTGEPDAYRYLGESIEAFPSGRALCAVMEEAGFTETHAEPLTGGIVSLYTATKPS
jgi:demethylmenaquinone methyltransferase/2-methoxy-6-polyprenyl-1,4-benzoquinol methylase